MSADVGQSIGLLQPNVPYSRYYQSALRSSDLLPWVPTFAVYYDDKSTLTMLQFAGTWIQLRLYRGCVAWSHLWNAWTSQPIHLTATFAARNTGIYHIIWRVSRDMALVALPMTSCTLLTGSKNCGDWTQFMTMSNKGSVGRHLTESLTMGWRRTALNHKINILRRIIYRCSRRLLWSKAANQRATGAGACT